LAEVLRENRLYVVELEEDNTTEHLPHRSWGTYRVVDRKSQRVLFSTPNRDKSFGVFEFATREAGLP
jgi:hypothetical protein